MRRSATGNEGPGMTAKAVNQGETYANLEFINPWTFFSL